MAAAAQHSHPPLVRPAVAEECRESVPDGGRTVPGSAGVIPPSREALILAAVKKAAFIVAQGGPHHIQRTARALSSAPLADLNQNTIKRLLELHPVSTSPMAPLPAHATSLADIDPARFESVLRKRVYNGAAPGQSGWTGSHLMAVWNHATKDGRLGLQLFIRDICNGVFAGELKQRLLSCVLVALAKKGGGVRPIAVGEVFVKLASHYLMSLIEDAMPRFSPSIQFGVKQPGGSETAAQLTRAPSTAKLLRFRTGLSARPLAAQESRRDREM